MVGSIDISAPSASTKSIAVFLHRKKYILHEFYQKIMGQIN